jgi:hypothetical protein
MEKNRAKMKLDRNVKYPTLIKPWQVLTLLMWASAWHKKKHPFDQLFASILLNIDCKSVVSPLFPRSEFVVFPTPTASCILLTVVELQSCNAFGKSLSQQGGYCFFLLWKCDSSSYCTHRFRYLYDWMISRWRTLCYQRFKTQFLPLQAIISVRQSIIWKYCTYSIPKIGCIIL